VAIELDAGRFAALTDADRWAKMDLFRVFREGKAGMVAANLALGAFQQRLADQLDIEPGAEMKAAIEGAREAGLPLQLVDRDIGVTLRRVYANVPWWQRLTILAGLAASVLSREEISEEEIERLKEGDMLEATFTEFAERSERLYLPLIAERDRYIAARLEQEAAGLAGAEPRANVLVVLGAGHLQGVAETLRQPQDQGPAERIEALSQVPRGRRWGKIVPWLIVAVVMVGFVLGFARSPALGLSLLADWVVINGGLAAIGALIALAHPVTILVTALAAPLTSLNPLVGAGFVAAGVELWLRKPNIGDFSTLRQDVTSVRGWWRNRVARTFLVFLLATLGSAIGTYLAGFRIFGRLLG
jgi:pheromone shutdown-related protein TraB